MFASWGIYGFTHIIYTMFEMILWFIAFQTGLFIFIIEQFTTCDRNYFCFSFNVNKCRCLFTVTLCLVIAWWNGNTVIVWKWIHHHKGLDGNKDELFIGNSRTILLMHLRWEKKNSVKHITWSYHPSFPWRGEGKQTL